MVSPGFLAVQAQSHRECAVTGIALECGAGGGGVGTQWAGAADRKVVSLWSTEVMVRLPCFPAPFSALCLTLDFVLEPQTPCTLGRPSEQVAVRRFSRCLLYRKTFSGLKAGQFV